MQNYLSVNRFRITAKLDIEVTAYVIARMEMEVRQESFRLVKGASRNDVVSILTVGVDGPAVVVKAKLPNEIGHSIEFGDYLLIERVDRE